MTLDDAGTTRDPASEWFVQGWCSLVYLSVSSRHSFTHELGGVEVS